MMLWCHKVLFRVNTCWTLHELPFCGKHVLREYIFLSGHNKYFRGHEILSRSTKYHFEGEMLTYFEGTKMCFPVKLGKETKCLESLKNVKPHPFISSVILGKCLIKVLPNPISFQWVQTFILYQTVRTCSIYKRNWLSHTSTLLAFKWQIRGASFVVIKFSFLTKPSVVTPLDQKQTCA